VSSWIKQLKESVYSSTYNAFVIGIRHLDIKCPQVCVRLLGIVFQSLRWVMLGRRLIYRKKAVLYVGQLYYYPWYLSRSLRKLGWKADVLNWDANQDAQKYYHGQDILLSYGEEDSVYRHLVIYIVSLLRYEIFHFSNAHGLVFGYSLHSWFESRFSKNYELLLLKECGKKIVYSHNACLDGVSQSAFDKWGPHSPCSICVWKARPDVCSDERNLAWGRFRNSIADYQCSLGGNRVDYNAVPSLHETPEFYCQDTDLWSPTVEVPMQYRIKKRTDTKSAMLLYHGIGGKTQRTDSNGVNIHCSHIYLPVCEELHREGFSNELIMPTDIPNKEVRFLQAQCDIVLDMLTYGWYGAMAREAMMLGKPVICFIRPEWLNDVRREIPDFADQLPIVNATPETVKEILKTLIVDREQREEIGRRSRAFAVKWHSAESGARRFDEIYTRLLKNDPQLLPADWFEERHGNQ
jgi:hypothetical protein